MKPTHKTDYRMDIKRHNVRCWLIGNCRDEPLTQRRKSYNRQRPWWGPYTDSQRRQAHGNLWCSRL